RYNNDFVQVGMLGRGGFASAYKARNKLDDIEYAIKKIRLLDQEEDDGYDKIFREIKNLARLEHHNVVRYYSSWLEYAASIDENQGDDDEEEDLSWQEKGGFILYIQMQLCPSTLHEYLKFRNQSPSEYFDDQQNVDLFSQILQGCAYIHQQGLIHRDLKPSNIFLSLSLNYSPPHIHILTNTAIIAANMMLAAATQIASCRFTPPIPSRIRNALYAAPEQLATPSYNYDEKADIYSLGIILFELYNPFSSAMERAIAIDQLKKGIFPDKFSQMYPVEKQVISSMMNPDPCLRPTALEIL
ncbi:hypothetical protein MUCCIDRAFT_121037, partial [Mucor lusitanicus CBS 277.49]